MIDILPKNASPILNKNIKLKIPIATLNVFLVKKLISGLTTVPVNHATIKKNLLLQISYIH